MQIQLLKPHTHAGVHYAVGARLDLPEHTARWLIDHRIARPVYRHRSSQPQKETPA